MSGTPLGFWMLFGGIGIQISETYSYKNLAKALREWRYAKYVYWIATQHLDQVTPPTVTEDQQQANSDFMNNLYFPEDGSVQTVRSQGSESCTSLNLPTLQQLLTYKS